MITMRRWFNWLVKNIFRGDRWQDKKGAHTLWVDVTASTIEGILLKELTKTLSKEFREKI